MVGVTGGPSLSGDQRKESCQSGAKGRGCSQRVNKGRGSSQSGAKGIRSTQVDPSGGQEYVVYMDESTEGAPGERTTMGELSDLKKDRNHTFYQVLWYQALQEHMSQYP